MKIAVDAIDLTVVRNPDIRTVVLVSGDGDFTPLVNYLKNQGKYIVGMGIRESTAEYLESSCNEFVYLVKDNREPAQVPDFPSDAAEAPAAAGTVRDSEAPARPSAAEPGTVVDLGEARELLRRSMEQADGEWVGGGTLKNKMLALMPGFNEDRYGYGRFIDFLQGRPPAVGDRGGRKAGGGRCRCCHSRPIRAGSERREGRVHHRPAGGPPGIPVVVLRQKQSQFPVPPGFFGSYVIERRSVLLNLDIPN